MVTFNSDIDVLNYALTLEHFEAALYKALIGTNILTGIEQQYLTTFGAQEQAHVDTLTQVIGQLGGTPVAAPASYNFAAAGPLTTVAQLLAVLQMVEDLGASAYLGAAGFIKDPMLLTSAVTIHAVEAEHAAIFRDLLGMAVAPDVVAKGTAPDDVIRMVTPFLSAPTGSTSGGTGTSGSTGSPSGGGATQSNSTTNTGTSTTATAPTPAPGGGSTTGSPSTGSGAGTSGSTGSPSGGGATQSNSTTGTTGQPGGLPPYFNRRLGDG